MPTLLGTPQNQHTTGSTTNTFSMTVPATGARRALRVFVSAFHSGGGTITGVTYNGVAMTKVGSTIGNINTQGIAEQYILVNPSTGANDVVITASAAFDEIMGVSSAWEDVNQAGPTTDVQSNTATSGAGSVTLTFGSLGSNVAVAGVEYYDGNTTTATETDTNLGEAGADAATTGYSDQYGDASLGWSFSNPSGYSAIGFVLVHDGGGGGGGGQAPRSMHQYRRRR